MGTKTAIIVGVNGQDGTYLSRSLDQQGYKIVGISREGIQTPGIPETFEDFSIFKRDQVMQLMNYLKPDEVYYVAAHNVSSETGNDVGDPLQYQKFEQAHVRGLINFLYAIVQETPDTRLFYASSSLIYDGSAGVIHDESTPFSPVGFYGLTKAQGTLLCREYRKRHGVFASSGILFNHESVFRPQTYLSMKLVAAAEEISRGKRKSVVLGDLDARCDWGYAPDFVDAFQRILRTGEPQDFVVGTGESHTAREFANLVFDCFGLDAMEYIQVDKSVLKRHSAEKIGNPGHLNKVTGWKPSLNFDQMVRKLVQDYLNRVTGVGKNAKVANN